jgi:hypothetical protein
MMSIMSFKELYMYFYSIWLDMYTIAIYMYSPFVYKVCALEMKVEPSTNLFLYFCGRHPNVWGPNVNSRSGKSNQSWAVCNQFVWLELPVLVPVSMLRTGPRIF